EPCTDELFQRRKAGFDRLRHPLVYTFGDNEWTDCDRSVFDPVERLNKLRDIFTLGTTSLGQPSMPLVRQSDDPNYRLYRENVRWTRDGVLFVALNIPGSNNGLGHNRKMDAEF